MARSLGAKFDAGSEPSLELFNGSLGVGINGRKRRIGSLPGTARRQSLHLANGQSATGNAPRKIEPRLGIRDGEQGAAVAGGNTPLFEQILNRLLEPQKAHDVGYCRAVFSGALRY